MECVVKPVMSFTTVSLIHFHCLIACLYPKGGVNLPE